MIGGVNKSFFWAVVGGRFGVGGEVRDGFVEVLEGFGDGVGVKTGLEGGDIEIFVK